MKVNRIVLCILAGMIISASYAQDSWKLESSKKGIKVWTQPHPDSKINQFKLETTISYSIENIVSLLIDLKNTPAWYDNVERLTVTERRGDYEADYEIEFNFPWPLKDKWSLATCTLSPKDDGSIYISVEKLKQEHEDPSGMGEVKSLWSEWTLTPVDKYSTHILHRGHMDMGGGVLKGMINSTLADSPRKTIEGMVKLLPKYIDKKVSWLH